MNSQLLSLGESSLLKAELCQSTEENCSPALGGFLLEASKD
jgi:hypothetical protein